MCWCTPSIRTPFCGKPECHPPSPTHEQLSEEQRFVEQYKASGPVRLIARRLYREMHPKGMRTNGPVRLDVDASTLQYLLERWRVPEANP